MALTNEEKIAALELTSVQKKAFKKLQRALTECENAGIEFIGMEEFHYAFNGNNLDSARDYGLYDEQLSEDEVNFNEVNAPSINMTEPFVNVSVALKVKT
ncbi:hypothetical protein [Comamonas sp.]|uniref:hypothetical protein n=1 Tax=Comamonas sp. TaxID=34028 RepID=UPI0012C7E391|nr:hypothetical protein [Comamonas sp.]MPS92960.1 hypothetical protein [Comamonas sp.]